MHSTVGGRPHLPHVVPLSFSLTLPWKHRLHLFCLWMRRIKRTCIELCLYTHTLTRSHTHGWGHLLRKQVPQNHITNRLHLQDVAYIACVKCVAPLPPSFDSHTMTTSGQVPSSKSLPPTLKGAGNSFHSCSPLSYTHKHTNTHAYINSFTHSCNNTDMALPHGIISDRLGCCHTSRSSLWFATLGSLNVSSPFWIMSTKTGFLLV